LRRAPPRSLLQITVPRGFLSWPGLLLERTEGEDANDSPKVAGSS